MKFAFSTLCCPSWSYKEIMTSAKDLGYDGVEIRGIEDKIYAPEIKQFLDDRIEETIDYLKNLGIKIPILSSGAEIAARGKENAALKEALDYIRLAAKLQVPYVRVLCTNSPKPNGGDVTIARKLYEEIADYAETRGVTPLIETNGIFSDTSLLRQFMDTIQSSNKGVLWDIHHPFRYNAESVGKTVENIGKYIKYCHIKDSVVDKGQIRYKMTGYGDIPIKDAVVRLRNIGYKGFLTFEWVKRWITNLEEPGVVLCHYINYMKALK
ncbi:MAG: sugar phosphate isomerase/epimerase family protein [Christensenellales bacterium]|jgi:sugar phosphate isomerase/epimerase